MSRKNGSGNRKNSGGNRMSRKNGSGNRKNSSGNRMSRKNGSTHFVYQPFHRKIIKHHHHLPYELQLSTDQGWAGKLKALATWLQPDIVVRLVFLTLAGD